MTNNNCLWLSKYSLKAALPALLLVMVLPGTNPVAAETKSKVTSLTSSPAGTTKKKVKVRLRGGQMQTKVENGKMVMTGFNGEFAGGTVSMTGRLASNGTGPQSADLVLNRVDLGQALPLAGWTAPAFLKGVAVNGVAKARWSGSGMAIGQNLTGSFALEIGSGRLADAGLLESLAKATGMPKLDPIDFTVGTLEGNADQGQITLTRVELHGPDFKLVADGDIDVRADDLDVVLNVQVTQELAQQSRYYKLTNVLSMFRGKSADTAASKSDFVTLPQIALMGSLKNPEIRLGAGTELAASSPVMKSPTVAEATPAPETESVKTAGRQLAALLNQ